MGGLSLEAWHATQGARIEAGGVRSYGDAAAEHRAVRESVGLRDAGARDRLLLTGEERLSFVQGLCTNDIEALPEGQACEAAFITPRGRLVADVRIVKLDDALLLDLEAGRGAALVELLAKYRIHEEVEWIDAAELLLALELWGPATARVLERGPLPEGEGAAIPLGETAAVAVGTAFGAALYLPASEAASAVSSLLARVQAAGGRLVGDEAVEPERLRLGLGRFGLDWDETSNPLEAGLDRALNYKKGCYVGQEVVAKATYIGQVSRRLVRLTWRGAPVPPGTELLGGRLPGRITSCAAVPGTDEVRALGVVRRDSAVAGTLLEVGAGGPQATVEGFPYRSREKPV